MPPPTVGARWGAPSEVSRRFRPSRFVYRAAVFLQAPPRASSTGHVVKRLLIAILVLGGFGIGFIVACSVFAVSETRDLIDDRALMASGVVASDGSVEGTHVVRRGIFHDYKLTLRFTDKAGVKRIVKRELDTVFGEVDREVRPVVRYDAKNPTHATCSWAVDVTASRIGWVVAMIGLAILGGFMVLLSVRAVRDTFREKRAAERGREIEASLAEVGRDQYGNVTYNVTAELAPGNVWKQRAAFGRRTPLWIRPGVAVALVDPEVDHVCVVDADGAPVKLSRDELGALRQRIAAPRAAGG